MQQLHGSRLLLGVVVVSFLFILGSAVTEPLRPLYIVQVGATTLQLGLIMALPSIVSLLIRVPVGAFLRRIGGWKLMIFSLILSTLTGGIFAFIYDPIWFFPVVSLSALSWAVFSPVAVVIVSSKSTPNTRGVMMGLYFASIGAAMFVGPLACSVFTLVIELRWMFLLGTIFPVLALVVFLLTMRPEEMEEEQAVDEQMIEVEGGIRGSLFRIMKTKNVAALSTARIAFATSMGVFSTIFPVYAESSLGLTPSLISLLYSVRGVTNVLTRMPAGRLSDRIGRRKPFLFAYGVIICVFLALAYVKEFYLLLIVMALFGIGWGMRIAPSMALLSDSVTSGDRPLALTIFMTMFDVGSTAGSLLVGFTVDFLSPSVLMLLCVPLMVVALAIFLLLSSDVAQ